MLEFWIWKLKN